MAHMGRIADLLIRIYGQSKGQVALEQIGDLLAAFTAASLSTHSGYPDQKEIVLITYGDSLRRADQDPLKTLHAFVRHHLHKVISTIHFLPFFPYSSDDGFSVVDYLQIDPALGTWEDVRAFAPEFRMMFDWVVNHVSAQSGWFAAYLSSKPGFERLAIEVDPTEDLSMVTRPRSLPLLTPFIKKSGRKVHLWTTFSRDQVDLNFKSIDVLLAMLRVMLVYVQNGADILRLDAIAYLWKEIGTACIHLPQTHLVVKLFRAVLDVVAPHVILISETNVPHEENISYFGDAGDEAQMVYNFSLPPLLLHCFATGDVRPLCRWAKTLNLPHPRTALFNFTASHDGIGVRPLEGLVASSDIEHLMQDVTANGGTVSYKQNPDGSQSPYELNITYVDALRGEGPGGDDLHAQRFLASQAIALVLPGVPAIYIHSLLGSRNWSAGVRSTGRARSINREKLDVMQLIAEIENPGTFRSRIFTAYRHMIQVRRAQPAFHPKAAFKVLSLARQVFAIVRYAPGQSLLALTNLTSDHIAVDASGLGDGANHDLLTNRIYSSGKVPLAPYGILWLTPADP
jgi:glucosylglycerate phosphorylase